MTLYRQSDSYIQIQLDKVPQNDKAAKRLALDLAAILTGPTSGSKADYIAECITRDPDELVTRLREIVDRYSMTRKRVSRP